MNVGKKLRKFIFLNVFAMMGMSCYILADTFFISVANGTLGIAALNLTLPVYGLLFAIGSLIGIGSATRYSLCKMTDNETSRLYFSNALMFAVLIGIGFTAWKLFPGRDFEADGSGCGYPVDRNGISADCDAFFSIFYCKLYLYCVCKK